VFAFGMTIFELLTMRPPYDELPRNPAVLHKAVRDGRRPRLTDKVIVLYIVTLLMMVDITSTLSCRKLDHQFWYKT